MRAVVDAHLPRRVCRWITDAGGDAVHAIDLPGGSETDDAYIAALADDEDRAVVTKDYDFVERHLLTGCPRKLLLLSIGNISNAGLAAILVPQLPTITAELVTANFLELDRFGLVVRG